MDRYWVLPAKDRDGKKVCSGAVVMNEYACEIVLPKIQAGMDEEGYIEVDAEAYVEYHTRYDDGTMERNEIEDEG